jgi:hypothetical protein
MMKRTSLAERNPNEAPLCGFSRLTDSFRHFTRLAVAETDPALLVADDDQRSETEAASALHHLRDAIDVNELVDEFAVALFPLLSSHRKIQSSCVS